MKGLLFAAASLVFTGFLFQASAGESATVFALIKDGNHYVSKHATNRVIVVQSEKSTGGLVPNVWNIIYLDPTAAFSATQVRFSAGEMVAMSRPKRVFASETPMDNAKLKVDSDKAIQAALKQPMLEKLGVKATEITLENDESGPTWKIKLWAAKSGNAAKWVDIGEVQVSAQNGKILRNNLHLNRAS